MEELLPNHIVKFSWMFRCVIPVDLRYYYRVYETDFPIQELMVIPANEIFSYTQCSTADLEIQCFFSSVSEGKSKSAQYL